MWCFLTCANVTSLFQDHPAVLQELDLITDEEQYTHTMHLEDAVNGEDMLSTYSYEYLIT